MKYNYIIFNSVESKIDFNPNGYYAICYNDVRNHNQIQCIDIPLQGYCKFWRYLYALHHSARINERINLPFKKYGIHITLKMNLRIVRKFVLFYKFDYQFFTFNI